MLFTDIDSLIYAIKTDNFFADITDGVDSKFDTSNLSKDHKIFSSKTKNVIEMTRDEVGGKQITECFWFRAKRYSYKTDDHEVKIYKGIKKNVIERRRLTWMISRKLF